MWIHKKIQKHIQDDFVNSMKESPFGPIFMAFYNEEFGAEKDLKIKYKCAKNCRLVW